MKDTVCELCRTSWHFACYFEKEHMLAGCGHQNWFLSGRYCGDCSRLENKCQCCGKALKPSNVV